MTTTLVDPAIAPVRVENRAGNRLANRAGNRTGNRTGAKVPAAQAEPEFGPIVIRSVAALTVIMFLGTGLPMWLLTGQVLDGIGLGAFCAFWGGPGFGIMAAGAAWTWKLERQIHLR